MIEDVTMHLYYSACGYSASQNVGQLAGFRPEQNVKQFFGAALISTVVFANKC